MSTHRSHHHWLLDDNFDPEKKTTTKTETLRNIFLRKKRLPWEHEWMNEKIHHHVVDISNNKLKMTHNTQFHVNLFIFLFSISSHFLIFWSKYLTKSHIYFMYSTSFMKSTNQIQIMKLISKFEANSSCHQITRSVTFPIRHTHMNTCMKWKKTDMKSIENLEWHTWVPLKLN